MSNELERLQANIGENIRRLRKARGWTLEKLSEQMGTGIDNASLSRVERGAQGIALVQVAMAAHALGATPEMLVREPEAEYEVSDAPALALQRVRPVPVVGTAQMGDDGFWLETEHPVGHGEGFVPYYSTDANAYALRLKGDSMRPRIKPGEFAVMEPSAAYGAGDEILVKVADGRRMVKILQSRRNGMVELYSINDAQKPITLDEAQVEAMHYVAGIVKPALFFAH